MCNYLGLLRFGQFLKFPDKLDVVGVSAHVVPPQEYEAKEEHGTSGDNVRNSGSITRRCLQGNGQDKSQLVLFRSNMMGSINQSTKQRNNNKKPMTSDNKFTWTAMRAVSWH